jgi:hypothetical protein
MKKSIPSNYTTEQLSNDDYLHFVTPISLITLSLEDEETIDERNAEVVDQAIMAYNQILSDKNNLLQLASTDPTYSDLAQDIIALAGDLKTKGYVESAIDLLDTLPIAASDFPNVSAYQQARDQKQSLLDSTEMETKYGELAAGIIATADDLKDNGYVANAIALIDTLPSSAASFPDPVSETSSLIYLIVLVILAIILFAFLALYLKARSSGSSLRQQVDEEAGRLDVLLVRVSKIDRQLAREVEQVKEQLERISGR